MTFDEYQQQALISRKYPRESGILYCGLGLNGEAGEVAEKLKKIMRDKDNVFSDTDRIEIGKEISDCLWYCAALADELGLTLDQVAQMNIDKLSKRLKEGKIGGSGDNR